MKIMNIKILIILIIAISMISSCNETETNLNCEDNIMHLRSSTHEFDTTNTKMITPTDIAISTTGVTKHNNGYLVFAKRIDFENTMTDIVNNKRTRIETWESSLNFVSRYSYWDNYSKNHPEISDDSIYRVPDRYFESVLDENDKIKINDTLYTFDFETGKCLITPDNGEPYYYVKGTCDDNCCSQGKWDAPHKYYTSDHRLECYKWRDSWAGIYSSIGIDNNNREKNSWGNFKPKSTPIITLFIDHWYEVEYYLDFFPAQIGTLTDEMRTVTNESDNTWTIDWAFNTGSHHCSPKFERFHFYLDDFWDDGHHDDNNCY